jgi:isopenicillin N synthase-like dioxygenase
VAPVEELPIIDVGPLVRGEDDATVAGRIDRACRATGFFVVEGHGVPTAALARLDAAARAFFALPEAAKAEIAMARGGAAWRGWFPEGAELTSGRPDHKEGLYFGAEGEPGRPLHGHNLFPSQASAADLQPAVEAWMASMTELGQVLCRGVALALGQDADWFERDLTADPTVLFRIFRYPPRPAGDEGWGVAEHTDYGLLTILAHDGTPGLQVRSPHDPDHWIDVPAVEGTFVVNLGDMLDRMTQGRYRSTPHRVRHATGGPGARDRLSFPFFFDPGWDAVIRPVPFPDDAPADDAGTRWDGTSVHEWSGTYGDYLTAKVAKVFPGLVGSN